MESVYIGLFLAAVSGITFLTFKYPNVYQQAFHDKIFWTALGMFVIVVVRDAAIVETHSVLLEFIEEKYLDAAKHSMEGIKASKYVNSLIIFVFIYSMFLSWFAEHMKKERSNDK